MRIPASLRRDTVIVTPYLGEGAYGPIYDDPVTYAPPYRGVYVEPANRQAVDNTGKETVANLTVFFDGDAPIKVGDRVEWQGRLFVVIDVQPQRPYGRTNHVEALLQSTEVAEP